MCLRRRVLIFIAFSPDTDEASHICWRFFVLAALNKAEYNERIAVCVIIKCRFLAVHVRETE